MTKRHLQVAGQGPMRRLKGGRAPNETDPFRRAKSEGRSADELLELAKRATPHKLGLKTTWGDRDNPVRGPDASVVLADSREVGAYGFGGHRVCGECRYFDVENGRREIIKQRFGERLVQEQEWQLKHLGVPVDSLGLCGASDGELAVTVVSKSCEQFRSRGFRGRR